MARKKNRPHSDTGAKIGNLLIVKILNATTTDESHRLKFRYETDF